jgi:hypothetical protein
VGHEIADAVHSQSQATFHSIQQLSAVITSYSSSLSSFSSSDAAAPAPSSSTFPNLTMPDFEIRGYGSNRISRALQITLSPIVIRNQTAAWEEYSVSHQGWIDSSLQEAMLLDIDLYDSGDHTGYYRREIPHRIYRYADENSKLGSNNNNTATAVQQLDVLAPVWQQSPVSHDTSVINLDLLSHPTVQRLYQTVAQAQPVLSEIIPDLDFLYRSSVNSENGTVCLCCFGLLSLGSCWTQKKSDQL